MFALQNWRVNPFERALFNLSRGCCGGSTNGGGTRGNSLNLLHFWNALQIWVSTCCNLYLYLYLKCFCCAAFNCTLHVADAAEDTETIHKQQILCVQFARRQRDDETNDDGAKSKSKSKRITQNQRQRQRHRTSTCLIGYVGYGDENCVCGAATTTTTAATSDDSNNDQPRTKCVND